MKKILFTIVMLCSLSMSSQKVNGVKIEDITEEYVNLQIEQKGMNPYKIEVYLDYGQMSKLKDKTGYIIGEDGERMKFTGIINALNFLQKKGFKLISTSLNYIPFSTVLFENLNN